ncbi:AAA-type ATPase, N-terminal domain [Dillenia turbinata]|uniref:AAA-type ATPase, N-terminal domain n=1 Tax=Dillenia turbinata TaxID=194707 RepID=A0AAN8ZLR9_9MAGN
MFSEETITTSKKIFSMVASLTASAFLLKTKTSDLIPNQVSEYFSSSLRKFSTKLSSQLTVIIDEFDGLNPNHIFKLNKPEKEKNFSMVLDNNEEIIDVFDGVKFKWLSIVSSRTERPPPANRTTTQFKEAKSDKFEKLLGTFKQLQLILQES